MDIYLNTLVGQVVNSYILTSPIRIIIDAKGITLDLARATPTGLIINELVTNSLKYAFPPEAMCHDDPGKPCTIGIQLVKDDGTYQLSVYDNGIGLPAQFDIKTTKTLGLKLVNFLSRHQLRANPEVNNEKGTEFVFRFEV